MFYEAQHSHKLFLTIFTQYCIFSLSPGSEWDGVISLICILIAGFQSLARQVALITLSRTLHCAKLEFLNGSLAYCDTSVTLRWRRKPRREAIRGLIMCNLSHREMSGTTVYQILIQLSIFSKNLPFFRVLGFLLLPWVSCPFSLFCGKGCFAEHFADFAQSWNDDDLDGRMENVQISIFQDPGRSDGVEQRQVGRMKRRIAGTGCVCVHDVQYDSLAD